MTKSLADIPENEIKGHYGKYVHVDHDETYPSFEGMLVAADNEGAILFDPIAHIFVPHVPLEDCYLLDHGKEVRN